MQEDSLQRPLFSILDVATGVEGKTPADAFHNRLELAQLAERLEYRRSWLAEHHNTVSVASSATAVLIGYIAGGTTSIRVGAGGIMLPNHSPLIVAEQFGTLEALYPGRIDLGLGRAPGTDQLTAMAIRGSRFNAANDFPQDVLQLQNYFSTENSAAKVRAIPGEGADIPIWILGSSTDSAHLAAALGLPYAFASHFAPAQFLAAIRIYRQNFKPSKHLASPYVLSCVNGVGAATDTEAAWLATSLQQFFKGVATGERRRLQPPVDPGSNPLTPYEAELVNQMLAVSFIGGPDKIEREIRAFIKETQVDEIMIASHIFDRQARLDSFRFFAEAFKSIYNI